MSGYREVVERLLDEEEGVSADLSPEEKKRRVDALILDGSERMKLWHERHDQRQPSSAPSQVIVLPLIVDNI